MVAHSDTFAPPQFGIRHLLLPTLVVSVGAAVAEPWLRSWGSQQWSLWGLHWGIAAAIAIVMHLLLGALRRRRYSRLPKPLWTVPICNSNSAIGPFRFTAKQSDIVTGTVLLLGALIGECVLISEIHPPASPFVIWPVMGVGFMVGASVFGALQNVSTAGTTISSEGVLVGDYWFPWNKVRYEVYDETLVLRLPTQGAVEIKPPPEHRPRTLELLRLHASQNSSQDRSASDPTP